jgi:regulator of protease activity HflC (stomatin/prohibitin superfamily)
VSVLTTIAVIIVVLAAVAVSLAAASIRILREYERAVVFRLGRLIGEKGPGLVLLIPAIDRMVRVDLRTVTLDIPPQNLITRDNVPAKVNAVCYFRVIDAARAVVDVERYLQATSQIAQTTLRSVLGKAELDTLLSEREQLNEALQQIVDDHTDPWGIKVTTVEIKDVEIPSAMQRAMALGAEAERERRAKVIHAEGEFQASQRLRDAADVISGNPASLQLRYLQTLTEIGGMNNSTVVFPLPLDIVEAFMSAGKEVGERASAGASDPAKALAEEREPARIIAGDREAARVSAGERERRRALAE